MKVRLQEAGEEFVLRIPQSIARKLGLRNNSEVFVTSENGRLVATSVEENTKGTLDDLLAQIREDNVHLEIDLGCRQSGEAW